MAKAEKLINPKVSVFLFSEECPKGEMFNFVGGEDSDECKAMLEDGWFDSPARLDLPEDNDTGVTVEQVANARPEDIIKLLESMGFIVLTPEQLKAEANKMAAVALSIEKYSDEEFIAEAERRGLKQSDSIANELTVLLDQFNESPESLTIDELVTLGNNGYSLGLRSNMKEATLITKINEALSEG